MNKTKARQEVSTTRQELLRLSQTLAGCIDELIKAKALTKGTVCKKIRKCGNPTCKCSRGDLHETKILSFSHEGKSRIIHLSKHSILELSRIEKDVKEYQRFRRIRAKLVYYFKQTLSKINKLEQSLLIEAAPKKGAIDGR